MLSERRSAEEGWFVSPVLKFDGLFHPFGVAAPLGEEADEFVEKALAKVKLMKELSAKYGPCPQCGSAQILQDWNKDKLQCQKCKHSWHRKTKEPWKYYELKQEAEELGLKVEIGEGKAKITPADITEVMGASVKKERKLKGSHLKRCEATTPLWSCWRPS